MGYFVGQAVHGTGGRGKNLVLAFVIPTLLHGLYDFPLLAAKFAGENKLDFDGTILLIVPVILAFEWIWTVSLVRRLRADQLAGAPAGTVPEEASRPGRAGGWMLILLGGILSSGGGLVTLAVLLAFAIGEVEAEQVIPVSVGSAIIGLLPLLVGLGMFRAGLQRLNAADAREHTPAVARL